MGDAVTDASIKGVVRGVEQRLKEISGEDPALIAEAVALEAGKRSVDSGSGEAIGRRLADSFVARARWRRAIGETIDTTAVTKLLGCSRQAIKDRVDHHRLLAIPGRRSNLYPVWQIDFDAAEVRPAAARWVQTWLDIEPDASPLTIAAAATTANDGSPAAARRS